MTIALAGATVFPALASPPTRVRLACSAKPHHGEQSLLGTKYQLGVQDAGFDLASEVHIAGNRCISNAPFFVSVTEPDGSYRVTLVLGDTAASATTVKAEARRLMLWDPLMNPGGSGKRSFVVNVRTPAVSGGENVRLKPRELGSLDWDQKLTLEFTGRQPAVERIEIQPVRVPTVYLAGDSTVVDQDDEPWAAWGQMLPAFFNDRIAIANEAESGETIASFVGEHRFDKIFSTMRPGDYLLMQFAHNDQKPGSGFVSIPQYKDLLRRYIAMTRQRKAHPILVTSMNRRKFAADGKILATLGDYPDAMREVARELNVPLIDLNAMSRTLFEAMGEEGTLRAFVHYPANTYPQQAEELKDDTHFNSYGALELAKCIVDSMQAQDLPLAKFLRPETPRFDPAHPDPPSVWSVPVDPFQSEQKPYER